MVDKTNVKVLIYDHDIFALHAINSYLAWDRRTRVHYLSQDVEDIFEWLADSDETEWPDFIILDPYSYINRADLSELITRFLRVNRDFSIVVFDHQFDNERFQATIDSGGRGYFLRNDIHIYAASALIWLIEVDFGISETVEDYLYHDDERFNHVTVMPDRRQYPELTDRIRQAIQLCVVEGMSADLAADEMGVSIHTIRSYIKEGYRILEAYDEESEYPVELSAQERAFIRYTALEETAELISIEETDDTNPENEEEE